ncbi:MAG: hypothetical protein ACI9VT_002555 [Psychroserpens sp.]|jgi:hypothetical protein
MKMENVDISGVLTTKRDELDFTGGDAYSNKEGNICIRFDEDSYAVLTPVMAKRLNKLISEAVSSSLGMVLSEE